LFPAELATGLCSLNPNVDRLVQSCLMEVDRRGKVVRYEIHDGVINSDARMTYTAVSAIVTDRDADTIAKYQPLVPMFELMHELFEILHQQRRRRGSIDFDLPEAEVVLSEFGAIEAIVATERNVAHRIIEEFMLLANETVATHLVTNDVPSLHRVHEAPDVKKVMAFEEFISTLGYGLAGGQTPRPKDFQRLVDRIRGTPEERPIAALMLRRCRRPGTTRPAWATSAWRRNSTRTSHRQSGAIRISSSPHAAPGTTREDHAGESARSSRMTCRDGEALVRDGAQG
jgi:ribonuclease R